MKQRDLHNVLKHRPYIYNTYRNTLEKYIIIKENKVYMHNLSDNEKDYYYPMVDLQKYSNWSSYFITPQQAQQLYPEYFI